MALLEEKLEKEIQNYAHEDGRHLENWQIQQVKNYLMDKLIDLDEISAAELNMTQEEFDKSTEEELITRTFLLLTPVLIEKLIDGLGDSIGLAFDYYSNDWMYES